MDDDRMRYAYDIHYIMYITNLDRPKLDFPSSLSIGTWAMCVEGKAQALCPCTQLELRVAAPVSTV